MSKTLTDYIHFLRENNYFYEAYFYQREVVPIIKHFTEMSTEQVLRLTTKKVCSLLEQIQSNLAKQLQAYEKKTWDVELHE